MMMMQLKKKERGPVVMPTEEQIAEERKRISTKSAYRKALTGTITVLVLVAALAVLISSILLPVMQVSGDLMEPTYKNNDILVLVKSRYIDRGDTVCFSWNNKTLLKRVIACPGDEVVVDKDGIVYVNGEKVDEPYVIEASSGETDVEYPLNVPDNKYFVMGDNRGASIDSRSSLIGCIGSEQMIGKVLFRVWPIFGDQ